MLLGSSLIVDCYCKIKNITDQRKKEKVFRKFLSNERYQKRVSKVVFGSKPIKC